MAHQKQIGNLAVELTDDAYDYNDKTFTLEVTALDGGDGSANENDADFSGLPVTATPTEINAYLGAALHAAVMAAGPDLAVKNSASRAARAGMAAVEALQRAQASLEPSSRLETMSQFATRADLWEARARRFAQALADVMDGVKDHDISGETGLPAEDCERIADARRDARFILAAPKASGN